MVAIPDTLDARHTLGQLEDCRRRRRAVEAEDLQLVAHWARLHSADPGYEPGPRVPGGNRLDVLGGDGAPGVQDLALVELGVARGVHTLAARAVTADVLDLQHRLPAVWARVLDLTAEAWVARKVAVMTRHLPLEAVGVVDAAVAEAIAGQAPSRVFEIAEAKIIEADPTGHEERLAAEAAKRFVALSRRDPAGLRTVIARVTAGDAFWVDATIARVADILGARPEHASKTRDELRAEAFGWLARPAELLALLLEDAEQPAEDAPPNRAVAFPADLLDALRSMDPARLRPTTTLYAHVHEAALAARSGTVRLEGLGPIILGQLADFLGHTNVALKPVIDLADQVSVNCYEHPESLKERVHLRYAGDAFPHASRTSRKPDDQVRDLDFDHVVPYDPGGPPGQTGTHNSQPLGRTGHRAKTHLGFQCTPLPTGEVIWRTRHGLHRIVDRSGTHPIEDSEVEALTGTDDLDRALSRLLHQHRSGQLRPSH